MLTVSDLSYRIAGREILASTGFSLPAGHHAGDNHNAREHDAQQLPLHGSARAVVDLRRPHAVLSVRAIEESIPAEVPAVPNLGGDYQPMTMFDSITRRACSRSEPVSCMYSRMA